MRTPNDIYPWLDKMANFVAQTSQRLLEVNVRLAASEERMRLWYEAGGSGSWEYDFAADRVVWSEQTRELLGVEPAAAASFGQLLSRVHVEDRPRLEEHIARILSPSSDDLHHVEFRIVTEDGTIRWLDDRGAVETSAAGTPVRAVGVLREITRRKNVEARERLAAIVTSSTDAIIGKTLEGIVTDWNEAAERMFGYPPGEMIGQSVRRLIPADRQQEEDMILTSITRGERIENYETLRIDKNGRLINVSVSVSPIRNVSGGAIGASTIIRDITERKKAEKLVRRQADLLNQSRDAVFAWNLRGGIVYWSRGAELLYGYTAQEAIGRISHEHLATRFTAPLQEIEAQIAGDGGWSGELTHTTRDGRTIVVESRYVRVCYDGETETYVLESNRDITERKAHEEHVRLLVREVNHRAKNMLSVVDAIAHQTAANSPEDFVERFSERVRALSANQDLLVRNEWKGIDIDELVRSQLAHFADLVGSRITAHGAHLRVNATSAQAIGLALHELATNAAKYGALSTHGGRVEICWEASDETFTMSWTEREGPPVSAPKRRGFGTTVVERMAVRSLGGAVDLDYAPSGLTWRLTCPAGNVLDSPRTGIEFRENRPVARMEP
jgi:PAS domain S-box-containing protein